MRIDALADAGPLVHWSEDAQPRSARWRSEAGLAPPSKVVVADDRLAADAAFRLAMRGAAILWRGDYHNGRHLLDAIARRVERKQQKSMRGGRDDGRPAPPPMRSTTPSTALDAWNAHRKAQAERARVLSMVVLPFENAHVLPLRRAPDVRQACLEAYGESDAPYVTPLRELLGIVGAHEWRKRGVEVAALGARIHPHYGVFAPIRSEYIDLVACAPLPRGAPALAFDIGTGTGVLAALLVHRGVAKVVATDNDPRAMESARDNLERLGMRAKVDLVACEFFPPGRAGLIVCNPPWIPGVPSSPVERSIFDPESGMLNGYLRGLAEHLAPEGEGWLILSDFAEHLGLRSRNDLIERIRGAGLRVVDRLDIKPRHPKSADRADPLHAVRAAETTSLWRLAAR